jgi:hypothetical protein
MPNMLNLALFALGATAIPLTNTTLYARQGFNNPDQP